MLINRKSVTNKSQNLEFIIILNTELTFQGKRKKKKEKENSEKVNPCKYILLK